MDDPANPLRRLPAVDQLLRHPQLAAFDAPQPLRTEVARAVIADARARVQAGEEVPTGDALAAAAYEQLEASARRRLRKVINATGVVLHTNLGRAPLSERAIEAVAEVAQGYSNLEYDLEHGGRGSRHVHAAELLRRLSGAEDAMVVNNNAAAVLLVLSALVAGREVVVSRGELVEIGGSFRIPDILAQSGCTLREVGTTNRTRLADYLQAAGEQTGALLKVHPSNYRVIGFTEHVDSAALTQAAHEAGCLCIEDLGSGALAPTEGAGLRHEPTLAEAVAAGMDIVTASGDKLLGGPQAGLILGRRSLVQACRRHPLARALRVDKMTLAALDATLGLYLDGDYGALPVWRMLQSPLEVIRARAEALAAALPADLAPTVQVADAAVGGGSLPGETLPTAVVVLRPTEPSAEVLAAALRRQAPAVVGRIVDDHLALDLRSVAVDEDRLVAAAVAAACT